MAFESRLCPLIIENPRLWSCSLSPWASILSAPLVPQTPQGANALLPSPEKLLVSQETCIELEHLFPWMPVNYRSAFPHSL